MQTMTIFFLVMTLTYYIQMIYSMNIVDENEAISFEYPECLSKIRLSQMLHRDRRASISRPYFQHWRQTRSTNRYTAKNSLAFSPRLGKRALDHENLVDNDASSSIDLNHFLETLVGHLQDNQIDIIYEDSTIICLSEPISDEFIRETFDQTERNRRNQDENTVYERPATGKHPILFRYRLG